MLSQGYAEADLEAVGLGDEMLEARPQPEGVGRYLVKLVRDRIERLEEPPEAFGFHPLDHGTHVERLRAKLLEEVGEYLLDPSESELADVYEAVRCLAHVDLEHGIDTDVAMDSIRHIADAKRDERGGFEEGIGMYAEWVVRA